MLFFISCGNTSVPKEQIEEVKDINKNKLVENDSNILKGFADARKDIKNLQSKYFKCDINTVNRSIINEIENQYNVKIVYSDCVLGNYERCYNHIIDSTLKHYYGVSVNELLIQ